MVVHGQPCTGSTNTNLVCKLLEVYSLPGMLPRLDDEFLHKGEGRRQSYLNILLRRRSTDESAFRYV